MPRNRLSDLLLKGLLLILLFLSSSQISWATHIVGGEISFVNITGYNYKLSLNLYSDAINGSPGAIDASITIYIYERNTNRQVKSYLLPKSAEELILPSNSACTTANFQTKHTLYTANISLNPNQFASENGYYMIWNRCCRNNQIGNILNPGDAASLFYLEFPALKVSRGSPNSSPQFSAPASDFGCVGSLFEMDFSATDVDGDRLTYEMATPINGYAEPAIPNPTYGVPAPYDTINWQRGFSADKAILGNPNLNIDSTGMLTVNASSIGLYVFGIIVKEWRNGVNIGQVRRDFQFTIRDCPFSPPITSNIIFQKDTTFRATSKKGKYDTLTIRYTESNTCARLALFGFDTLKLLTAKVLRENYSENIITISPLSGELKKKGDSLFLDVCGSRCSKDSTKIFLSQIALRVKGCPRVVRDTIYLAVKIVPAPPVKYLELFLSSNADSVLSLGPNGVVNIFTFAKSADSPSPIYLSADFDFKDPATKALVDTNHMPYYGMRFRPESARNSVTGKLYWEVDCDQYRYFEGKTIKVKVKAMTVNNCVDTVKNDLTLTLNIEPFPSYLDVTPPNVLTIDGDGINETFSLPISEYPCRSTLNTIKIYNRWGVKVYESNDQNYVWHPVNEPAGLYYYLAYYREYTYKGWLQLIK